ncbi:MAG TPA: succinylglutamate desuccinylase/aspartoacylase family protein [Methanobacterium sp.]|nr:succinylglutamate desuccinylase/aspartoacylase family protein [Methanobacterium sp.]
MVISKNISIMSNETSGQIEKNAVLMEYLSKSSVIDDFVNVSRIGTPLIKIGHGTPRVMITSGIHGNELPPQIAAIHLIENLLGQEINGTIYVIPFAVPHATMENTRRFKGIDMNRAASKGGFISNSIINTIKTLKISAVGDFHSTKPGSNPGIESVFCSKKPSNESYSIAKYITDATSSKMITHSEAGKLYNGALEDECNLAGIPAVTCEVVSRNGMVDNDSHKRSYIQMELYLKYFNMI